MDSTATLLEKALLYGLLPLWIVVGFADYLCHRVLRIEYNAGAKEAALHLLLLFELGGALLAAMLFEINAALIALLLSLAVVHELTAWWDLLYAASRRSIPVPEQWVHGLQQMLPWVALGGLMLLHPAQTLAVFGSGGEAPDWTWRIRPTDLPPAYLAAAAVAGVFLVFLPFAAEYRRCRQQPSYRR